MKTSTPWRLRLPEGLNERLQAHLFPGDDDEHGAVLAAGIVETDRGTVLLGRDLFLAIDGIDFIPGTKGYKRLTPQFVNEKIRHCRDEGLVYLAIHNHGAGDRVEFSNPDRESHARGYPALIEISGHPVGALVLASGALAGEVWTEDGGRHPISETVVIGRNIGLLHPNPPPPPPQADSMYDRGVRWFGDRGQARLGAAKVGVIGGGGVGQPLVGMLARLGVGTVILVEPERIAPTNLPRLPEARRLDAMMGLRRLPGTGRLADRLSTTKVALARRVARRANPKVTFIGIRENVVEPDAARALVDCDFLFLAADSHQARLIFNVIVHQYLIPGIQIGTKIEVDAETGEVGEIRGNVRLVLPEQGCLRCAGLIDPTKVQEESLGQVERERNRYLDEVAAPSVINFNTFGAAQAVSDFTLMLGGFIEPDADLSYRLWRPRERRFEPLHPLAGKPACRHCGTLAQGALARGDGRALPGPQRT
jgi:molybdopterin/thiamine biosynthesis adenylyltransferase